MLNSGLSILMISGLFIAGCESTKRNTPVESTGSSSKKDIVIEYWTTPLYQNVEGEDGYGEWEKMKLAEFQKEYPNVKFNFQLIPSDAIEQKVTVAALGNKLPDIVMDGLDRRLMKYVQFGKSEEVSDFISDDLDDYTKTALDIVSRDGNIYGIPISINPEYMFINKKIFQDKGLGHLIPENREWTFDQWRDALRQVSGDGIYGSMIYAGNEQSDELPLLYLFGNGVEMWNDENTEIVMDRHKDAAAHVIRMFKDMMADGSLVPNGASLKVKDALDMFRQGKLAMFPYGQAIYDLIETGKTNGTVDRNIELYGIKPVHRAGLPPKWALSVHGYTLFRQTNPEKRAMIKTFIRFMTSKDNTKLLARSSGSIPARMSAAYDSNNADREEMMKLLQDMPVANIGTASPYYADVRALWFTYLQAALLDNMTPEEAIDEFTQKSNERIREKMKALR